MWLMRVFGLIQAVGFSLGCRVWGDGTTTPRRFPGWPQQVGCRTCILLAAASRGTFAESLYHVAYMVSWERGERARESYRHLWWRERQSTTLCGTATPLRERRTAFPFFSPLVLRGTLVWSIDKVKSMSTNYARPRLAYALRCRGY